MNPAVEISLIDIIILLFLLGLCTVGVILIVFIWRRIVSIEKQLIPFLKILNDKNYRLWKAKVKAEKEIKKNETSFRLP